MRKRLINHLGMALFVFVALSGLFLWMTGSLHFGGPPSIAASPDTEKDGHGAEEAHGEHGDEAQCSEAEVCQGGGETPQTPSQPELADLEEKTCEHNVRTLDCDDCRFELGVVKVERSVAAALLRAAKVQERSLGRTLRLTGQVQQDPTRVVDVASLGPCRVTKLYKFLGDKVQAGDLLAVVRSGEFGEAKAAYIEALARFQLAKHTLDRERDLFQKQASSEADLLDATKEHRAAEASLAADDKRLHMFGLDHQQVEEISAGKDNGSFADLALRASRAGTIVGHNITEGKVVDASQALFTIADLSNVWVWGDLYERDLATLRDALESGNPVVARVRVAAYPNDEFVAKIDLLGNHVDEHTRTIKVRLQASNAEGKLKPGMFAVVEARLETDRVALVAPKEAVLSDEGRTFAFLQWKDDLWVRRDVTVGRANDQYVEILSGLPVGAVVASRGGFMLKSDVLRGKMGAGCAD